MATIIVGAVVYLKSGGPKMTATKIDEGRTDPLVTVEWFSGSSLNINRHEVPASALTDGDPAALPAEDPIDD